MVRKKNDLLRKVSETIHTHRLLKCGDGCLVALSGGADSVSLLLVLHTLGYRIEAAHCNFHLRGDESNRDERFCSELCNKLQVTLHVTHFNTKEEAANNGESIEMAARRLRYAWFESLRTKRKLQKIAVGHHRDDNVETMLLNLVRGTGIRGLTGMAYERDNIIRPFLDVPHSLLLQYLKEKQQAFVTDSTNADTHYKRNFVRNRLIPMLREMNPSVEETLTADMQRLQAAETAYNQAMDATFDAPTEKTSVGYIFPPQRLQLQANFHAIGKRFGFSEADVSTMANAEACSERAVFCSGEYLAAFYRGNLEVCRRPPKEWIVPLDGKDEAPLPDGRTLKVKRLLRQDLLQIPRSAQCVAIDAEAAVGALQVRLPSVGERFSPFGMKGSKLLSDFLTNQHVSQLIRQWIPVVADEKGILWLVGKRIDQRAAITDKTTHVLLLSI